MTIQTLKSHMPDFAKDTKLNLSKVINEDAMEGLSANQTYQVALASAYATQNQTVIASILEEASSVLSDAEVTAAKAAASIMAMNNVYYRFAHLVSDKDYMTMPANLRMTVIGNPGIDKVDFELMSLAVSAINGCGMCMDAHVNEVIKGGISKQGVQTSIRIASVLMATAQTLTINESETANAQTQAA